MKITAVECWTVDGLIVEPISFHKGYTPTPMAPGLDCRLDMTALARYTQHYERIAL